MVRVVIDRGGCVSCGTCWDICPSFFEQNPDDSFSQVIAGYRISDKPGEGEVPPDLEGCVIDASETCPVQVISIDS
jgi:ferredoxin